MVQKQDSENTYNVFTYEIRNGDKIQVPLPPINMESPAAKKFVELLTNQNGPYSAYNLTKENIPDILAALESMRKGTRIGCDTEFPIAAVNDLAKSYKVLGLISKPIETLTPTEVTSIVNGTKVPVKTDTPKETFNYRISIGKSRFEITTNKKIEKYADLNKDTLLSVTAWKVDANEAKHVTVTEFNKNPKSALLNLVQKSGNSFEATINPESETIIPAEAVPVKTSESSYKNFVTNSTHLYSVSIPNHGVFVVATSDALYLSPKSLNSKNTLEVRRKNGEILIPIDSFLALIKNRGTTIAKIK